MIDDTPTKRYGPHVEGADIHHNPTPGPADQQYLYVHVWVTLSLAVRHSLWGTIGLPLRALLYVRQRTLEKIPQRRGWRFRTKLELAAELLGWWANIAKLAGKSLWMAVDGAYAKRPFLAAAQAASVTIVSRLRKHTSTKEHPMNRIAKCFDRQSAWPFPPSDEPSGMFDFAARDFDQTAGLQWHMLRPFDPTVGQWIDEEPIGFEGDDQNLRPYVGP